MKKTYKGLTNDITVEKGYIVKKSKPITIEYLDKKNEKNVLLEFIDADQKIMLKPAAFSFENGELTSKFQILTNHFTIEELGLQENHLKMVASAIKEMHEVDVNKKNIKNFDYEFFLDFFYNGIKTMFYNLTQEYEIIKQNLKIIDNLEQVISHNDLVPGNILINDQELVLIDYDFVMLNNKFFDIASFITETCSSNDDFVNIFIEECLNEGILKKNEMHILNFVIKYQDLLWTLWANYMYEKTKKKIYYKIAKIKYKVLKERKDIK